MLMLEPASILTLESFRRLPPIVHKGNPGSRVSKGHTIEITLDEGNLDELLVYRNLSEVFVEAGQEVFSGDVIGVIKPASRSSIAHLVVELVRSGKSVPPPSEFPKVDRETGKGVFLRKCAACHEATSTYQLKGPGLKGRGKDATDDTLREILNKKGRGMPSFKDTLTPKEKEDVIAYMKTL